MCCRRVARWSRAGLCHAPATDLMPTCKADAAHSSSSVHDGYPVLAHCHSGRLPRGLVHGSSTGSESQRLLHTWDGPSEGLHLLHALKLGQADRQREPELASCMRDLGDRKRHRYASGLLALGRDDCGDNPAARDDDKVLYRSDCACTSRSSSCRISDVSRSRLAACSVSACSN